MDGDDNVISEKDVQDYEAMNVAMYMKFRDNGTVKFSTFGDEIEIQISLSKLSAVRFRMKYEIIKVSTGEVVHRAETAHCFVAPGLVPLNLKKKFPEVYQVFENYLEPEDN